MVCDEHGLYSVEHETYSPEFSWSPGSPPWEARCAGGWEEGRVQDMAYPQGDLGLILGTDPGLHRGDLNPRLHPDELTCTMQ